MPYNARVTIWFRCQNGHEKIEHKSPDCPLCAMRRHVKAAQELLSTHAKVPSLVIARTRVDDALLRLEAAINLAGQRTPDLTNDPARIG